MGTQGQHLATNEYQMQAQKISKLGCEWVKTDVGKTNANGQEFKKRKKKKTSKIWPKPVFSGVS